MATAMSPPASPASAGLQRPVSMLVRPKRSSSRMSFSSRQGATSTRSSEEDNANQRTAVKVAVRVRPPLQSSDPGFDLVPQRFRSSTVLVPSQTSLTVESSQGKKLFVFDRVFGEDVDQQGVWEYLRESVNSFVQGYNVSIMAYGQSGAGKSYTMGTSGPEDQADMDVMGIVPRAAAALFEQLNGPSTRSGIRSPTRYSTNGLAGLAQAQKAAEKNWQLKASYVEIYQEQLRDLLLDDTIAPNERPQVMIREDTKGRILLTGLRQVPINSVEDLLNALNFGSAIRQTDATAINARSSRSHAIFSLNLVQKKSAPTSVKDKRRSVPLEAMLGGSENLVTLDSKLHFVDLAGSERLKNTGAQGERAKEGISINAGLASLGKVIAQLSSRQFGAHVSYRDSKLTRMLQDSLGGNAITYMVACVNPVEFHLSETLNTVQYAQRARAIQSRPEIQASSDDSDKQAVIDRLRAEVSFLRDQIRMSDRSDRRSFAPKERDERVHGREVQLQNQLLDVQENYSALSQRHAKLITELAGARDNKSADAPVLKETIGESALDRLKRSNSFAEAVEQVVLEYEKTIQSLEASLSNTRTTLSANESSLLEKESKLAYLETLNTQLQSRIQKAMDRETTDDSYLRDLEARVAGAVTGEEKNSAVVAGLRKELTRARENETSCEEYISTLEERLAEAEQDHEVMQREIDRLEHVVERQRSIGKLDNLLYELDHMRQGEIPKALEVKTNGHAERKETDAEQESDGSVANKQIKQQSGEQGSDGTFLELTEDGESSDVESSQHRNLSVKEVNEPTSPAQTKFMADKLETVTHELFGLRVEHESTLHDFDNLQQKYQIALQALAELQDSVEESRKTPEEPAAHGATIANGVTRAHQPQRSLSSELARIGETSDAGEETLDADDKHLDLEDAAPAAEESLSSSSLPNNAQLAEEMNKLKELHTEKETHMAELQHRHDELEEKHRDTLDYVEELRAELQKAQANGRASPAPQIIRRKSSQPLPSDRATRSFAALRNMALDSFEGQPDKLQGFEVNLNSAMMELHTRAERVEQLEGEVASLRREMEAKMTIINGLTRERSSLKATSPLDISAISSMQDQLLENENRIRELRENHANRERELLDQIEDLRSHNKLSTPERQRLSVIDMPGNFPVTPGMERSNRQLGEIEEHENDDDDDERVQHLQATIADLEGQLVAARSHSAEKADSAVDSDTVEDFTSERKQHEELVQTLQRQVEEHKSTAATAAQRLVVLQASHDNILRQVEDDTSSRSLTEKELQTHRDLVANLDNQLQEHKKALATHQQSLETLRESHAQEIQNLTDASNAASLESGKALEEHRETVAHLQNQLESANAEHQQQIGTLRGDLNSQKSQLDDLLQNASLILGKPLNANDLTSHLQSTTNARKDIAALHETATNELQDVRRQLEESMGEAAQHQRKLEEMRNINDETIKELERVGEKEKKSSMLVEELEQQLNSNFDQHKAANHRLSTLQAENMQLEMTKRELEETRGRVATLEAQLQEAQNNRRTQRESLDPRDAEADRSSSAAGVNSAMTATTMRKSSVSAVSLPSPPPAIPLPPLPSTPLSALPGVGVPSTAVSPPASRHSSKDIATATAQLAEDQEARIRTIEKHLFAEKQLTATLEEALTDLESSSTKMKAEMEAWRRKCGTLEEELGGMRKQRESSRMSVQQLEEERDKRKQLEAQQARLEARLTALANNGKKKKSALACF